VRVVHVGDVEPQRLRAFRFLWRPVRRQLAVEAFGVNAYTQPDAGGELIEEHDETGSGAGRHQELYVVLAGRARFTVAGQEIDAPAGTLVFCDDPAERRGAIATEPDTTVLVVGGRVGEAFTISPWEWYFRADAALTRGDPAEALAVMDEGFAAHPDNASMSYNAACYACLAGDGERAVSLLLRALELDPALARWVPTDDDLAPIRDDSRVRAALDAASS
jgi:tetratricopeptide (TPR) repeat protein